MENRHRVEAVDIDHVLPITPAQVRGARAMLRWSMLTLAREAGVSVSTVKRFENELPQPVAHQTASLMQVALTRAGIDFLPDRGEGDALMLRSGRADRPAD